MRDLLVLVVTTIIMIIIWTGVQTAQIANQSFAPKDLLEMSTPINGTIDAEYLRSLP